MSENKAESQAEYSRQLEKYEKQQEIYKKQQEIYKKQLYASLSTTSMVKDTTIVTLSGASIGGILSQFPEPSTSPWILMYLPLVFSMIAFLLVIKKAIEIYSMNTKMIGKLLEPETDVEAQKEANDIRKYLITMDECLSKRFCIGVGSCAVYFSLLYSIPFIKLFLF